MQVLDFLQNLALPSLLAATVFLSLLLCWVIFVLVRLGFRVFGLASAKSLPIHDMVMVTSLMFALMLSFSAAGIWNDWVQARGAVQREALALENVLALADGLSPERTAKVRAGVIAYARAAAEQEWPAMAEQIDMDDPLYDVSDRALVGVIAELSREVATPVSSATAMALLPQIFEARAARLARLTLASAGLSGVQWFVLVALMAGMLAAVALVYNDNAGTQAVAMNLWRAGVRGGVLRDPRARSAVRGRDLGEPAAAAAIGGQGRCRNAASDRAASGREIASALRRRVGKIACREAATRTPTRGDFAHAEHDAWALRV